ncbi:hypothetical protein M9458_000209, partial [Cirrhinus mrigala]
GYDDDFSQVGVKFVIPPNQTMLIVGSSVGGGFIMFIIILVVLVKVRTNEQSPHT